ncbi:MAG: hypothetical protein ACP5GT_03745 [Conexivisphaera sp.]
MTRREALELGKLRICRWCVGRLHTSDPGSVERTGLRVAALLGIPLDDAGCALCGGMFSRIDEMAGEAARAIAGLEARSFYVSVSVPRGAVELEDELRSRLRLRGGMSAKRLAIRMLSRSIEGRLGVPARPADPDVILRFSPRGFEGAAPMPAYVLGRYLKPAGVRSRGRRCPRCGGAGCAACNYTGVSGEPPSLERRLIESLMAAFEAEGARIAWIGTDPAEVEVSGRGRPFVAKVLGARLRTGWQRRLPDGSWLASLRLLQGAREVEGAAAEARVDVVEIEAAGGRAEAARLEAAAGTAAGRGRILRAEARSEGGALAAAVCAEHGADLISIAPAGARVRVVDVVGDCSGYPLAPPRPRRAREKL